MSKVIKAFCWRPCLTGMQHILNFNYWFSDGRRWRLWTAPWSTPILSTGGPHCTCTEYSYFNSNQKILMLYKTDIVFNSKPKYCIYTCTFVLLYLSLWSNNEELNTTEIIGGRILQVILRPYDMEMHGCWYPLCQYSPLKDFQTLIEGVTLFQDNKM